jgi:hypothetical protein
LISSSRLTSAVGDRTAGTPLAAQSSDISNALRNAASATLFDATPPPQRGTLVDVVRGSFTTALNDILLVAAVVSFVAGILAFVLIRTKDFASASER